MYDVKKMYYTVDTLTGSTETGDLPWLSSNVQQMFRPATTAVINVLKEFSELPELRCNFEPDDQDLRGA